MKIKDIQIDGFGVWSGLSVHSMPDSMTVFYGPNEAGKTTLMQFLRTMFYGFTTDRRQRYLPPVHSGKPGGAIRVTGPGGGYEINRRATLDQNGTSGALTVTGNDGITQGQHRLAMLLGQVDESIFTNVFAIGLRELQELSTLDDTAAADELYKLSSGLDRVSLVDVTRQLKAGRQHVVGPTPEAGQIQQLGAQKEKLKDEIDQLTANGKKWSELAALRNAQNTELAELKQQIGQWELEAKSYEVAIQVRPNWVKRSELSDALEVLSARTDLPDALAGQLAELNEQREEREEKLATLRTRRKELRDQARKLPLRRGILSLAAKIEAAAEQQPWIAAIQKNIQRVQSQIEQAQHQLLEDAERLGVSEEDQQALLDDRRMTRMPDLSRQAINQLAEPASEVRMWSTRLKQAKQQVETEKAELQRLEEELEEASAQHGKEDIQEAMRASGEVVALLRKRIHIQETLDKQVARREQLEEEAIDLTCDEALPVERAFLMGILLVGGGFLVLWGLGKLLPFLNTADQIDSQGGFLFVVSGLMMLFFGFMWSNVLDKSTVSNLEDVEDQIDAIRKEIRKTENERDDMERRLPAHSGSLETRMREAQNEVSELEGLLPIQHNHIAVSERYETARKRAGRAADSLRTAKTHWQRTLAQLGLSESMSPKSIRVMADGYESLLQGRKRLQGLEEELENRQLELGAITQRIDALSRQVFAVNSASEKPEDGQRDVDDFTSEEEALLAMREEVGSSEAEPVKAGENSAARALDQLNRLTSLISSQEQYIHQKRGMREQDQQLAKQMSAYQKSIDKIERSHSALLAEHGCESEEQLGELLEAKTKHLRLESEIAEFGERIQAVIGGAVPYEAIERLLDGPSASDLEKRWETLGNRTQQAEQRVEQLHLRQGELGQEMKSLAGSRRLAEAKLELSCVENQIKSCAEHWQTLAVTTGLLDKVCEVYETERQPETLREASAFLSQLTEGKYVRIWTPLGKNQLRIDHANGQALPLEVLSRGTREAVFISLRLSLAAAYARRGVTIPLVLDDVLVNFDSVRAESAAKVLRDFASLGHQVVMFTCHEHIMRIFHEIGVQVRVLPPQGQPGEAEIYYPEIVEDVLEEPEVDYLPPVEPMEEEEPEFVETILEEPEPEPVIEPAPVEEPVVVAPAPVVIEEVPAEPTKIDWLWYEQSSDEANPSPVESVPQTLVSEWIESDGTPDADVMPPSDLWWAGRSSGNDVPALSADSTATTKLEMKRKAV